MNHLIYRVVSCGDEALTCFKERGRRTAWRREEDAGRLPCLQGNAGPSLQQFDHGDYQAYRPDVDAKNPLDEIHLGGFDGSLGFLPQGFDVGFGSEVLFE